MPFDRRLVFCINWPLIGLTAILFGVGVLNLYSASGFRMGDEVSLQPFYNKQLIWGLGGLFCMLAMVLFDYKHLATVAWPLVILTVVLLVLVLVAGKTVSGAKRWLPIAGYAFQPSELAKIAILLLAAKILSKRQDRLGWLDLAGILAVIMPVALLIIVEPDLGTGLNVMLLVCGLILFRWLSGPVFKTLVVAMPVLLPCGWFFIKPYQKGRILTLFDPQRDPLGAGYHIIQSQIAIGSGQMWGKGFLEGTQSQLRYLPEKHTDFALAVFAEEWGFVGDIVLLPCFASSCCSFTSSPATPRIASAAIWPPGCFSISSGKSSSIWVWCSASCRSLASPALYQLRGQPTIVNFTLVGIVLNVSMRRFLFKKG
jgi:rod shape determining protein RodA